jgi:rubrerythrin
MIADTLSVKWLVRLSAPWVWRSRAKMARKLEGFASTEAGSALDMLKAAELTQDPKLRRLFFIHAMDEARHAQMFRAAARQLDSGERGSEYNLIHATRQNLLERLGLVQFIAFVYLAEQRGETQFRALAEHFAGDPEMEQLFQQIGKDEQFHVSYSGRLLRRWRRAGRAREVFAALASIRFRRAADAWRRAGRQLGDLMTRALLSVVYLVVLPIFVLAQRKSEQRGQGWQLPAGSSDDPRRQY